MTRTVRTRFYGAALTALVFGACNGNLKVSDEQSALDGGPDPDSGFTPDTGSTTEGGPTYPDAGNPADCPSSAPAQATACNVTEGQLCRYETESSYFYCGCWEAAANDLQWYCLSGQPHPELCPSQPPIPGSSCFGARGTDCYYPPKHYCNCPSEGAADWICQDPHRDSSRSSHHR